MSEKRAIGQEISELIATFRDEGERAQRQSIQRLKALGSDAVPELKRSLRSAPSARERRWAATALGKIGHEDAVPELVSALGDARMSVRLHAIRALVEFGDRKLGKAIVPLLGDPSGGVRVNAVAALLRLRVAEAGKEILERAGDDKWYVRQHVARAIGELKIKEGLKALRSLTQDPNKAVRNEAAKALMRLEASTSRPQNVSAR